MGWLLLVVVGALVRVGDGVQWIQKYRYADFLASLAEPQVEWEIRPSTKGLADAEFLVSGLSFTDSDTTNGEIAGTVIFSRASNETLLSGYALYLATGSSSNTRELFPISVVDLDQLSGITGTLVIDADTRIGSNMYLHVVGIEALDDSICHGEIVIVDLHTPYANEVPTGVTFTDSDVDSFQIAGTVTFVPAANEVTVLGYRLYLSTGKTQASRYQLLDTTLVGNTPSLVVPANTAVSSTREFLHVVSYNSHGDSEFQAHAFVVDKVASEISVSGNGQVIANGDTSPSLTDHTQFPDTDIRFENSTHTFTITETTSGILSQLNIATITLSGDTDHFSILNLPTMVLEDGAMTTFEILFNPITEGTKTISVIIESDAETNPLFSFDVSGIATTAPDIQVTGFNPGFVIVNNDYLPGKADSTMFDSVHYLYGTRFETFTITNVGSGSLEITSLALSGTDVTDFEIESNLNATTIEQAESATFTIQFRPELEGTKYANVTILSNDADIIDSTFIFTIAGVSNDLQDRGYAVYDSEIRLLHELEELDLLNDWNYFTDDFELGALARPGYFRDEHFTWLQGIVQGGMADAIFQLPEEYRPSETYTFVCDTGFTDVATTCISATPDGLVSVCDVSVVSTTVRLCGHFPSKVPRNQVYNGDFSVGSSGWVFSSGDATASVDFSTLTSVIVTVSVTGSDPSSVQLRSSTFRTLDVDSMVVRWQASCSVSSTMTSRVLLSMNDTVLATAVTEIGSSFVIDQIVLTEIPSGLELYLVFEVGKAASTVTLESVFASNFEGDALFTALPLLANPLADNPTAGYFEDRETGFVYLRGKMNLQSTCATNYCTLTSNIRVPRPQYVSGPLKYIQEGSNEHVLISETGELQASQGMTEINLNHIIIAPSHGGVCGKDITTCGSLVSDAGNVYVFQVGNCLNSTNGVIEFPIGFDSSTLGGCLAGADGIPRVQAATFDSAKSVCTLTTLASDSVTASCGTQNTTYFKPNNHGFDNGRVTSYFQLSEYDHSRTQLQNVDLGSDWATAPALGTPRVARADLLICLGGHARTDSQLNSAQPITTLADSLSPLHKAVWLSTCSQDGNAETFCTVTADIDGRIYVNSTMTHTTFSTVSLDGLCFGGSVFVVEIKCTDSARIDISGGAYIEYG